MNQNQSADRQTVIAENMRTYTGLLSEVTHSTKDIDNFDLVKLLQQAEGIPNRLLPFRGVIHVIDYTIGKHVALSGPFKNIMGYHPKDFIDNGLGFVIEVVQKEDFKVYNEKIFSQTTEFLKSTPQTEHSDYIFSSSYRVKRSNGEVIQIYQQGTYITCPKTSLPLYGIGMSTDISPLKKDTNMFFSIDKNNNENSFFNYKNIVTEFYNPYMEETVLTAREKDILLYMADGKSSKQIAGILKISINTVSNHRQNMLRKTNSKNAAELINYALLKKII